MAGLMSLILKFDKEDSAIQISSASTPEKRTLTFQGKDQKTRKIVASINVCTSEKEAKTLLQAYAHADKIYLSTSRGKTRISICKTSHLTGSEDDLYVLVVAIT